MEVGHILDCDVSRSRGREIGNRESDFDFVMDGRNGEIWRFLRRHLFSVSLERKGRADWNGRATAERVPALGWLLLSHVLDVLADADILFSHGRSEGWLKIVDCSMATWTCEVSPPVSQIGFGSYVSLAPAFLGLPLG
jgi:hypothetical protein